MSGEEGNLMIDLIFFNLVDFISLTGDISPLTWDLIGG